MRCAPTSRAHRTELSEQSRATLDLNPLRVLDSKRPEDAALVADAPMLIDYVSDEAGASYRRVLDGLSDLEIAFIEAPRLVRGLDYYTRTTFEFASNALDAAQNAVGGGGRYDGLVADLGGPDDPGVGFALGVDRTLLACDAEDVFPAKPSTTDVFVVVTTTGTEALLLANDLRSQGWRVERAYDGRSMKAQMKAANKSGAPVAVIVGEDEAAADTVTVRPMAGDGDQVTIPPERSHSTTEGTALMMRTHTCGELSAADAGKVVTLTGWVNRRREHGEHLTFVDLRDHTGVTQCVMNTSSEDGGVDVRSEYVLEITGTVTLRTDDTINPDLPTGEIELKECAVEVLSAAEPPPFPLDQRADDVDEMVRLRYRYLDMRRERMQRNMRIRSKVNAAIRNAMAKQDFVEVETPMLMPSTPEGAREFLVPSRQRPGSFYALPQSPQLYKQLLMVGGLDRYYQIARCLRDEDLRADRQYEFMQLDMEMSFCRRRRRAGCGRGRSARCRRSGDRVNAPMRSPA